MHTHSHVHVVITQIVGSFIQDAHNMGIFSASNVEKLGIGWEIKYAQCMPYNQSD